MILEMINRFSNYKYNWVVILILAAIFIASKFKSGNVKAIPRRYGFQDIPTFYDGLGRWSTRRQFEQALVDNRITWFVYIKYDEDHRPLVVGKSGSKLVNYSGSDVSFSTNLKDGPARVWLRNNNKSWQTNTIAIVPKRTERGAYKLESKILRRYRIYGS
jgi:hypothetical protein